MKAQDLRIGNTVNYQAAEGDILPNTIDWQDLKWLSEGEKGFNLCHSPIPLTEECLLKLGFEYKNGGYKHKNYDLDWYFSLGIGFCPRIFERNISKRDGVKGCFYVHTLQNLYFALTGEELTLNP
jgi:hypothetical protein